MTAAPPYQLELLLVVLWAGLRRWLFKGTGVESIDRLESEALHPVLDQVGPHHAVHQSRLPGLVDHVAPMLWLEVRSQCRQKRRKIHQLLDASALCLPNPETERTGNEISLFDAPHPDPAVAAVLLEHPRACT